MQQLPLAVKLSPEADFAEYVAGPNAEALAAVTAWARGAGEPFLLLFGPPGSGKSHLLQAACRAASARSAEVLYLPLGHPGLEPSALADLDRARNIALDDLQSVAGNTQWERSLFDLYNRLRETGRRLLVSADAPLASLPIGLPDLRSRLGWGPGYRLRPLEDEDCERLLLLSARRRGLRLGVDAIGYIMRRCPRDAGSLLGLLDRVDGESLRTKRRPTLAMVRRILGDAD
jgi:DnaA family protein